MRAVREMCAPEESCFCRFIHLKWLNTHTRMCQNAVFASIILNTVIYVLSEIKQLRKKAVQQYIGSGQLLKWQQSNIPAVCHWC